MPVCPSCEYEYVEGITICPDCGEKLISEKFFSKPEEWTEENWALVFTSDKEYEIEMLKENLESAGIAAAVLSQKDRNFPSSGDFSLVKLFVRKENVQEALDYIQETLSTKNDNPDEE